MAPEVLERCFAISGRISRAERRHPGGVIATFGEEGGFPCVRLRLKVNSLRLVDSTLIEKLPAKNMDSVEVQRLIYLMGFVEQSPGCVPGISSSKSLVGFHSDLSEFEE